MSRRFRVAAFAAACLAPCVHAETQYVVEQVYVAVSSAPDGTGNRVGQIRSGDQVELIERQGEQAHVRLTSGDEGWVKASYLSSDPPLRQQLAARTEELAKVSKEKAQLEAELAIARSAAASAQRLSNGEASQPEPSSAGFVPPTLKVRSNTEVAGESTSSSPPLFPDQLIVPAHPSWVITLCATALALAIGFALGWRMLDRRIRAKYGGLRIY